MPDLEQPMMRRGALQWAGELGRDDRRVGGTNLGASPLGPYTTDLVGASARGNCERVAIALALLRGEL